MIVIKKIKLYQDPELDEEGRPITKPLTEEEIKQRLKSPLKEGVLKYNNSIDIDVIKTKKSISSERMNKFYENQKKWVKTVDDKKNNKKQEILQINQSLLEQYFHPKTNRNYNKTKYRNEKTLDQLIQKNKEKTGIYCCYQSPKRKRISIKENMNKDIKKIKKEEEKREIKDKKSLNEIKKDLEDINNNKRLSKSVNYMSTLNLEEETRIIEEKKEINIKEDKKELENLETKIIENKEEEKESNKLKS